MIQFWQVRRIRYIPATRSMAEIGMRWHKLVVLAAGALLAFGVPATAHHSYAMFDPDNPIDLTGVVQEFKFGSPHTFIILKVKDADGNFTAWSLEGLSATAL